MAAAATKQELSQQPFFTPTQLISASLLSTPTWQENNGKRIQNMGVLVQENKRPKCQIFSFLKLFPVCFGFDSRFSRSTFKGLVWVFSAWIFRFGAFLVSEKEIFVSHSDSRFHGQKRLNADRNKPSTRIHSKHYLNGNIDKINGKIFP